jgi:pyruvate/2-oxoglutarate dehydrogenase complex dihydrolipoamide acyltransferase (E2) component
MTEVMFPALSKESPAALGILSIWFVRDGEQVAVDQLLAEVQVDKVSVEVPSPAAGVIHLLVDEDAEVPQGTPIADIDT